MSALRGWLLGGASALLDRAAPLLGPGAPGGGTKAVRLSGAVLLGNLAAAAGRGQLPGGAYSDLPVQVGRWGRARAAGRAVLQRKRSKSYGHGVSFFDAAARMHLAWCSLEAAAWLSIDWRLL